MSRTSAPTVEQPCFQGYRAPFLPFVSLFFSISSSSSSFRGFSANLEKNRVRLIGIGEIRLWTILYSRLREKKKEVVEFSRDRFGFVAIWGKFLKWKKREGKVINAENISIGSGVISRVEEAVERSRERSRNQQSKGGSGTGYYRANRERLRVPRIKAARICRANSKWTSTNVLLAVAFYRANWREYTSFSRASFPPSTRNTSA